MKNSPKTLEKQTVFAIQYVAKLQKNSLFQQKYKVIHTIHRTEAIQCVTLNKLTRLEESVACW